MIKAKQYYYVILFGFYLCQYCIVFLGGSIVCLDEYIYFELCFPTGKARACGLETLSLPSGVKLKIRVFCENGNNSAYSVSHYIHLYFY